ncbi:MAG: thiopurine S-methyltransferase, partial [Psychrosphaera sp.]|nr:thiopurine S-methyltransferase [Psychrosphaera sp.]
MEADFWHNCWDNNQTGWHQDEFHPLLTQLFAQWAGANVGDVFVPLCGKSHDMVFISQSHKVLGCELSNKACEEFFSENKLVVDKVEVGHFTRYQGQSIELLAGDFFALDSQDVQTCSLIYDRAALIALTLDFREKYVKQLRSLFPSGTKLM